MVYLLGHARFVFFFIVNFFRIKYSAITVALYLRRRPVVFFWLLFADVSFSEEEKEKKKCPKTERNEGVVKERRGDAKIPARVVVTIRVYVWCFLHEDILCLSQCGKEGKKEFRLKK